MDASRIGEDRRAEWYSWGRVDFVEVLLASERRSGGAPGARLRLGNYPGVRGEAGFEPEERTRLHEDLSGLTPVPSEFRAKPAVPGGRRLYLKLWPGVARKPERRRPKIRL